jgi:hypothetical protein
MGRWGSAWALEERLALAPSSGRENVQRLTFLGFCRALDALVGELIGHD